MPLVQPEKQSSAAVLLLAGIPALCVAILCSMLFHHYAHEIVRRHACPSEGAPNVEFTYLQEQPEGTPDCPAASLSAIGATLALALGSFGLLLHSPRNLLFASLAFVNATMRLPGALVLFGQMVLQRPSTVSVDEASAFQLLHFGDPAGYLVILCFYIIAQIFLAVIIVHDTKTLPWKWVFAIALFVFLPPFEGWVWTWLRPLLP